MPDPDIIDAHVHVWSADTSRFPLAPGFGPEDFWFPSFDGAELVARAEPMGVRRFNLVQMTWYGLDHSYILDLIQRDPRRFTGTGIVPAIVDVGLPDPDRAMQALAEQGIRAFRVRGHSARPRWCLTASAGWTIPRSRRCFGWRPPGTCRSASYAVHRICRRSIACAHGMATPR